MNIAIIGFDIEGRSTYDYFKKRGHNITIHDQNEQLEVPTGATAVLGETYLDNLGNYDLVIRTAGLPPSLILEKNPDAASKISSHINEFMKVSPTKQIIGITGTKGKGTTSTLTHNLLRAQGKHVRLGGNIGVPPLSFLDELTADSWVVLELSSFQLIDLQTSPPIAACLMVVPEHLNWHADMDDYVAAKSQLFAHQAIDDVAIYYADSPTSKQIASAGPAMLVPYYQQPGAYLENDNITINGQAVCKTSELALLGAHNWQNVCAALTVLFNSLPPAEIDIAACRQTLIEFTGLPHRLEFVRELDQVRYYDDSFGTTPETAIVALQAFTEPKVIILGGSDKGADYHQLAETLAVSDVRRVLLIGQQADRIQQALDAVGFTNYQAGGDTMSEIIANAQQLGKPGDVVMLSTAAASFDMFANYKDRGEQFKRAVQALR